MKDNGSITDCEKEFTSDQRIVSSTTSKGVITYVNQDFLDISGFTEEELMGQAHNIVRHPDMPEVAFQNLWDTVKDNRPWMGAVKNRCKNGDYYWVDAFITPMIEGGETIGFQSVRLKPSHETINRADALYQRINKGESWITKIANTSLSLSTKVTLASILSLLLGLAGGNMMGITSPLGVVTLLAVSTLSIFTLTQLICRPWAQAAKDTLSIFDNPLARIIYTGRNDDLGQLQLAIKFLQAKQNTVIWRTTEEVSTLQSSAANASEITAATESSMNALQQEVDMVSTAMTEMTATVQEVAQNVARVSSSTQDAHDQVYSGRAIIEKTENIIGSMSDKIDESSAVIQQLSQNSEEIGSVVDVINGVAEQTNLLALNAAIEAARAGEMGRGFAVVADEVRSLAGKTQSSTEEISRMIVSIQDAVQKAVHAMDDSKSAVNDCAIEAKHAVGAFDSIIDNVNIINDMSAQIATAAEEQTLVSSEISRNIVNISDDAATTLKGCQDINQSNTGLANSVNKLNSMIVQFGT